MKKTILLIDDDADFRNRLKRFSRKTGFPATKAIPPRMAQGDVQTKPIWFFWTSCSRISDPVFVFSKPGVNRKKERKGPDSGGGSDGIQGLTELKFDDRLGSDIFPPRTSQQTGGTFGFGGHDQEIRRIVALRFNELGRQTRLSAKAGGRVFAIINSESNTNPAQMDHR